VLTAIAIVLALLVLPAPWGIAAVVVGASFDLGETLVLWRWSRQRRARVGVEALVGRTAAALGQLTPEGQVKLDGELWRARSDEPVERGAHVVVKGVEGLTLVVGPGEGDARG
jgi:membrane protein implicated in regulation of membrane protease activity